MFYNFVSFIIIGLFLLFPLKLTATPFSEPKDAYYCDFSDFYAKTIDIVERCTPDSIEIAASSPAIIKIGYRYIGTAPVYVRIKNDCPQGTLFLITAEPLLAKAGVDINPLAKKQASEYFYGSSKPARVYFDLEKGATNFTYYNYPEKCPLEGYPEKRKFFYY